MERELQNIHSNNPRSEVQKGYSQLFVQFNEDLNEFQKEQDLEKQGFLIGPLLQLKKELDDAWELERSSSLTLMEKNIRRSQMRELNSQFDCVQEAYRTAIDMNFYDSFLNRFRSFILPCYSPTSQLTRAEKEARVKKCKNLLSRMREYRDVLKTNSSQVVSAFSKEFTAEIIQFNEYATRFEIESQDEQVPMMQHEPCQLLQQQYNELEWNRNSDPSQIQMQSNFSDLSLNHNQEQQQVQQREFNIIPFTEEDIEEEKNQLYTGISQEIQECRNNMNTQQQALARQGEDIQMIQENTLQIKDDALRSEVNWRSAEKQNAEANVKKVTAVASSIGFVAGKLGTGNTMIATAVGSGLGSIVNSSTEHFYKATSLPERSGK